MSEILDKPSSYNIFNYLLPGALFAAAGDAFISYSFAQKDVLLAVFTYYLMGSLISRIGSLIIESARTIVPCSGARTYRRDKLGQCRFCAQQIGE
jgi:hypothetical protein